MKYSAIQSLLDAHLATLVGLPKLQLENTKNIAETGKAFSRAVLLPGRATPRTIGLNGKTEFPGLYQIDLFYPMDKGTATANQMADAVIAHFARGLVLNDSEVSVKVDIAWREAGSRNEPFYHLPVMVQWSSVI